MGSVGVVVLAVVLGHDFGFQQGMKQFDCEQFVTEFAVDFSPTSKALVEMSRHVAPEAAIHLIHVCSDAMEAQMRYASVNDGVIGQYPTSVERKANKQLVELAEKCGLSTA